MAMWLIAAMSDRMDNTGLIETFWHDYGGAKIRYDDLVNCGKYIFVYLTSIEEAYPSGVD